MRLPAWMEWRKCWQSRDGISRKIRLQSGTLTAYDTLHVYGVGACRYHWQLIEVFIS